MNRYFVIMLALWLLFVAGYFLISKAKRIKTIPVSLFLVTCISQGLVPSVLSGCSKNSQFDRLIAIGEKHGFYKDGKFVKLENTQHITYDDEKTFSGVMDYVISTYDPQVLQELFTMNVDTVKKNKGYYSIAPELMSSIGLDYNRDNSTGYSGTFSISSKNYNNPLMVAGYDYCFTWDYYSREKIG